MAVGPSANEKFGEKNISQVNGSSCSGIGVRNRFMETKVSPESLNIHKLHRDTIHVATWESCVFVPFVCCPGLPILEKKTSSEITD